MKTGNKLFMLVAAAALAVAMSAAGTPAAADDHLWGDWADCDKTADRHIKHCSETISEWQAAGKQIRVHSGQNGSVSVVGWDKNVVRVQATLMVRADSEKDAEEIAAQVNIRLEKNLITATGPETGDDEYWSVFFRVWAPHDSDLDLVAENGGVGVKNVSGKMRLSTRNGPLYLKGLSGDVFGRTKNGPLTVHLEGTTWSGKGLDAETQNGPVNLRLPGDYSAVLESGTHNGPWNVDLPVSIKRGTWFTAELGDGGAPVRVVTSNGPLSIEAW